LEMQDITDAPRWTKQALDGQLNIVMWLSVKGLSGHQNLKVAGFLRHTSFEIQHLESYVRSLCLSFSPSHSPSLSPSPSLPLSLSTSLPLFLRVSLSPSQYLSLSLSFLLFFSPSLPFSIFPSEALLLALCEETYRCNKGREKLRVQS